MDFNDFELDPLDLAFALGISEEMADEEMERLKLLRELQDDSNKLIDNDDPY